jgi:hypothetical protein
MAASTGPLLALGGITMANASILHGKPIDLRVPVATALACGMFALAERAFPLAVPALAWLALGTVLLTRVDPSVPSPAESLGEFWSGGSSPAPTSSGIRSV